MGNNTYKNSQVCIYKIVLKCLYRVLLTFSYPLRGDPLCDVKEIIVEMNLYFSSQKALKVLIYINRTYKVFPLSDYQRCVTQLVLIGKRAHRTGNI